MKHDWKSYSVIAGVIVIGLMSLFFHNVLFFLLITLATVLLALILGFFEPLKYTGLELITLTTMLVGVVYGPWLGGLYGLIMLIVHLVLGRYYISQYVIWLVPEYIALGMFSGILGLQNLSGTLGLSFIIGMNVVNLILTAVTETERVVNLLPYAIGNSIINSLVFIWFFNSLVTFIG